MIPFIGRSGNGDCRGRKKPIFAVGQEQGRNKGALWGLGWCLHDRSLVKTQNCALERGTFTICKLYLKNQKHVKKNTVLENSTGNSTIQLM